jgi:hypothetical protein
MDLARNLIGRINVGDSLTRTAASRPDQLAVVDGDLHDEEATDKAFAHGWFLPKTSTGKIQKNVLRSEHADHYQEA